jgi:hypothetical protein
MSGELEFNLQQYLSEMRSEQRADTLLLSEKIDGVKDTLGRHNTRITIVENTRRVLIWLGASFGLAVIGFLADMLVNHFKGGQ